MSFLKNQPEWTRSYFEANLFCILNSLRKILLDPKQWPFGLFTGTKGKTLTDKDRAKIITDFIFKHSELVAPSGVFSVFSGLLQGLVQSQIQALLSPSKQKPTTAPAPDETEPSPARRASAEITPGMVEDFGDFHDLADALGGTLVASVPEFDLLRRAPPAPPSDQERPLPFLEAISKVFSPVVEKLTHIDNVVDAIKAKKAQLTTVQQGRTEPYLSEKSANFPGACINAVFEMITATFQDPSKARKTALAVLIEEGEPPKLNDRGKALQAILTPTNVENISQLLELNILKVLFHLIDTVEQQQDKDDKKQTFLLDSLSTILGSMQEAIHKADTPSDTPEGLLKDVEVVTKTLLPLLGDAALPTALVGVVDPKKLEPLLIEGVQRGTGVFAKNLDTIVSAIVNLILQKTLRKPSSPLQQEAPVPQPAKEEPQEPAPPKISPPPSFSYPPKKKNELKKRISGLFPGLHILGGLIARGVSKFFKYGAVRMHCFVDAALSSIPPEAVAKEVLSLSKDLLKQLMPEEEKLVPEAAPAAAPPVEKPGAPIKGGAASAATPPVKKRKPPITAPGIITDILKSVRATVLADFKKIDGWNHPYKAFKLGLAYLGLSLVPLLHPKILGPVIGLRTHKDLINYIGNILKGGVAGTRKVVSPPSKQESWFDIFMRRSFKRNPESTAQEES